MAVFWVNGSRSFFDFFVVDNERNISVQTRTSFAFQFKDIQPVLQVRELATFDLALRSCANGLLHANEGGNPRT